MLPAQETRAIRKGVKRPAGRKRNKGSKKKMRSDGTPSHGFLEQQFQPLFDYSIFAGMDPAKIEADFYQSLRHFSKLYGFEPFVDKETIFPANMLASFDHAKASLTKDHKNTELSIIQTEKSNGLCTALAASQNVNPGWTLYYLPIDTLDRLHQRKDSQTFGMMLSVFAYLNLVAGMPLPFQNDYHDNCFDAIQEWLMENEQEYDEDDFKENRRLCTGFRRKAPILEKAIRNRTNLPSFASRLGTYKAASPVEKKFRKVAQKLLVLYNRFPTRSFYQNIPPLPDEPDDDEYPIYPDEYFSFFWTSSGWLYENLMEYVNTDLQEKSRFHAPQSVQVFDRPHKKIIHNLDFENQLLNLICELAEVLDQF